MATEETAGNMTEQEMATTLLTEDKAEPPKEGETLLTSAEADDAEPKDGEPKGQETEPKEPQEPVKYEPFTLPEGIVVDEAYLNKFTETAGKMGLKQDQAQGIVDLYTGMLAEMDAAYTKMVTEEWANETRNDPTFSGKDGAAKLRNVSRFVRATANEMGEAGQEFLTDLAQTGFGNKRTMALFLNHVVSKMFTADQIRGGKHNVAGGPPSRAADLMFGDTNSAYQEE